VETYELRNPEDGDDAFSETSARTSDAQYEVPEYILIDTALKASKKTAVFQY
jgi:hypothetical protein